MHGVLAIAQSVPGCWQGALILALHIWVQIASVLTTVAMGFNLPLPTSSQESTGVLIEGVGLLRSAFEGLAALRQARP